MKVSCIIRLASDAAATLARDGLGAGLVVVATSQPLATGQTLTSRAVALVAGVVLTVLMGGQTCGTCTCTCGGKIAALMVVVVVARLLVTEVISLLSRTTDARRRGAVVALT